MVCLKALLRLDVRVLTQSSSGLDCFSMVMMSSGYACECSLADLGSFLQLAKYTRSVEVFLLQHVCQEAMGAKPLSLAGHFCTSAYNIYVFGTRRASTSPLSSLRLWLSQTQAAAVNITFQ